MRFVTSALLAALAIPLPAQQPAAPKRPMTFADLMAMKRVSDPQISPSGKWVLFSVTDVSLEKNTKINHLWIVPLDGTAKEKQLTFGDGESNGRFARDGHAIALTMKDQIYTMPWNDATGTAGSLTQITNVNGGADGAIWSPDSQRLLFTVTVYPECSDLGDWAKEDACDVDKQKAADASPVKAQIWDSLLYRHWDHFTGKRRSHISVVDADGHNLRDLTPRSAVGDAETPTFSLGGPRGYAWAPDSHEIAYETNLEVGFAKPGICSPGSPTSVPCSLGWPQPGESTNNDIFTLKLDEHNAKAIKVSTSPGSDDGPQYSPDGKWLAWRSQARNGYESDQFKLALMDRATSKSSLLTMPLLNSRTAKFDNWVDEFAWTPDSAAIIFASPYEGEEAVFSINIEAADRKSDIPFLRQTRRGEYSDLQLTMVKRFVDGQESTPTFNLVATRMQINEPAELALIPLGPVGHQVFTVNVPPEQKVFEPRHESFKNLTHLNDELVSDLDMPDMESFWFAGANGTRVQGFLLKPPNFDPSKKYPVKFLMHGGPQTAWGDAWSYRWNWELFAADGYVVIGINRRGSTGYGQKFVEEVSGDWGGRAYIDLMKGLDYAEQHYSFIDKNRECALGASYGGYMANWVLTHTNRFKCIVTHDGMSDPTSAFGTTEELWFNEWEFRQLRPLASASQNLSSRPQRTPSSHLSSRPERAPSSHLSSRPQRTPSSTSSSRPERTPSSTSSSGPEHAPSSNLSSRPERAPSSNLSSRPERAARSGETPEFSDARSTPTPDAVVEQTHPAQPWDFYNLPASEDPFRKWSPMRYIKDAHTPTLIIHSQRDYRLDVSQGMELFTALQLLGVPSRMLYFPDEGHWVLKPQNSQLWNETVNDWCDRWLGMNKYANVGPEKNPAAATH